MRYSNRIVVLLVLVIAPNLIWLATSTVRIHNASAEPVADVGYVACDTTHEIGTLAPGQSVFRFLQACGDDTLEIAVGQSRFCRTYVEGELYHVDATIGGVDEVRCAYDDLLSSLFLAKALL